MTLNRLRLALLAAPLAVAACMTGTPGGSVVPVPATPGPVATATPAESPAPSGSQTPPGVFFRDDFDGTALDPMRWKVFERDGRVIVKDGRLEMLVGGQAKTFPLVLPVGDNIPKEGPTYVETRFEILSAGKYAGFNLDYLPPSGPDEPGVTEPFLRWGLYQVYLNFQIRTETRLEGALATRDSLRVKVPHRFRLEFDGDTTYRVIYDDTEIRTIKSRRRPTALWFGSYPIEAEKPTGWATFSFDSVESGVLVTPDPARPPATPIPQGTVSPEPTPTGSASDDAGASPDANASPDAGASPEASPSAEPTP